MMFQINNTPFFAPTSFPMTMSAFDDSTNIFAREIVSNAATNAFSSDATSSQDVEMIDVENVMDWKPETTSSEDVEMIDVENMMDWKPVAATNVSR